MKEAGEAPASFLREAGFSVTEMLEGGYSVAELREAGFLASDLRAHGCKPSVVLAAGYDDDELLEAGYTMQQVQGGKNMIGVPRHGSEVERRAHDAIAQQILEADPQQFLKSARRRPQ